MMKTANATVRILAEAGTAFAVPVRVRLLP
jgi:hypothetical protein